MGITAGTLIHDLASAEQPGTPVLIQVSDYRSRLDLLRAVQEEAEGHGIQIHNLSAPAEMMARMSVMRPERDALAVLIDAGRMTQWAPVLEARRELLPQHVRFLLVFLMREDIPQLEQTAPAFWSWAKVGLETDVQPDQPLSSGALADEMERRTGHRPAGFLAAWRRGEIADTFENSSWLNLATALAEEAE